jgi:hypothetical protein
MNCKTTLKNIIRCKNEIQPTAQARLRLEPTHRTHSTKPYAVLQPVFFVMVFVSQHTCSTFIFFKRQKKNKRAAPTAQNKNPRQKKLSEAK